MSRDWLLYLDDLIDSAEKLHRFVKGRAFERFASDEMLFDAVLFNLEVIGEAVKKLPEEAKATIPEADCSAESSSDASATPAPGRCFVGSRIRATIRSCNRGTAIARNGRGGERLPGAVSAGRKGRGSVEFSGPARRRAERRR